MRANRRWFFLSSAIFGLTGCSGAMPLPADTGPLDLKLASDGLRVPSANQRIDFGRAEAGVVAAVSKLLNAAPDSSSTNAECGAGPIKTIRFGKGLDLLFQDGDFRGWSATSPAFATTSGISRSMTRAQLEAAGITGFQKTTLGTEFEASGVFGLLEQPTDNARVDLLWAGVSCFFR